MNPRDEESRQAREDADWQAFVDSYGDRPEFPEPEPELDPEPVFVASAPEPEPEFVVPAELREDDDPEDRFVPPPPPPIERPHGLRALAWFGLFGVPAIVLLLVMVSISLPTLLVLLLLAWFVGGFGYLVATMNGPTDPDSGWDDGAVL